MAQSFTLELLSMDWVSEDVVKARFSKPCSWQAGQYLRIVLEDFPYAFYTIANQANDDFVELHMQVGDSSSDSRKILNILESKNSFEIEMPMGKVQANQLTEAKPLILIAAGTCFAQLKAITEQLLLEQQCPDIHIYWAGKHLHDLYDATLAEQWERQHQNISFSAFISKNNEWDTRHEILAEAVLKDYTLVKNSQFVLCGSPFMVKGIRQIIMDATDLDEAQFHSDAFEW